MQLTTIDSHLPEMKIALMTEHNLTSAEADHQLAIKLGQNATQAVTVFRQHIVNCFIDKSYLDIKIKLDNGLVQQFSSFDDWLAHVCELSGLPASTSSSLKSFVYRIADPAYRDMIEGYELDDVLGLPEGNMQRAAQAAGKISPKAEDYSTQMGNLVTAALTLNRSEFEEYLKSSQLSRPSNDKLKALMVTKGDTTGIFIPVVDDKQFSKLSQALIHVAYVTQVDPKDLISAIYDEFIGTSTDSGDTGSTEEN